MVQVRTAKFALAAFVLLSIGVAIGHYVRF